MIDTTNKLVELARKWQEFSQEQFGWKTKCYKSNDGRNRVEVQCYFAISSTYNAVKFSVNDMEFEVSFHDPYQVTYDRNAINHLEEIFSTLSKELMHLCNKNKENEDHEKT